MPSSIPYDPSLTFMDVVSEATLKGLQGIAKAQEPVVAAKDSLNSLISSRRSLIMTRTELNNFEVPTDSLDTDIQKLDAAIASAATGYASAKMTAQPQITKLRKVIRSAHSSIESPIDHLRSEIKTMPLAADAMNLKMQYFSFDSNSQNAASYSTQIASYVSAATSDIFGPGDSLDVGTAASSQVSRQVRSYNIQGTLILSVSCTHKNASIVAPFVLHIDKAIHVWNCLFPGKKLDPKSQSAMMKIVNNEGQEDKEKFSIISGTTYGSSFVGMVHVLKSTNTSVSKSLTSAAQSLQATADSGVWLAKAQGNLGVDSRFASDVQNMLSQQNSTSHVTILTAGVAPWTVANEVSTAEVSRADDQATELQVETVKSTLRAPTAINGHENVVLDVNSMFKALEDYLRKAKNSDSGAPINYYLEDIDQKMLVQMWAAKYFTGQIKPVKYDDSEGAGPGSNSGQPEKAKL